jgi:hypothetical protein
LAKVLEICTVLLIRSEAWYKHHAQNPSVDQRFKYNSEYAKTMKSTENIGKIIGRLPYRITDKELMQEAPLMPHELTPTGAAAFWLGIDLLRKIL